MLKLIIDPAPEEPVGFTWLPDGESTPPVVVAVGGRAVEVTGALDGGRTPPVVAGGRTPPVVAGGRTPPVVAGGRAGETTELAGDIALLVTAGLGDEVAGRGAATGLETGVATGAPAPLAADNLHWERSGLETRQAPGRLRARVWLRGRGMLLTGKPRR